MTDEALSILVNGESRQVPQGCTLASLLDRLGLERPRVAVAINRQVIPRSTFEAQRLVGGDRIEILEAVGGG